MVLLVLIFDFHSNGPGPDKRKQAKEVKKTIEVGEDKWFESCEWIKTPNHRKIKQGGWRSCKVRRLSMSLRQLICQLSVHIIPRKYRNRKFALERTRGNNSWDLEKGCRSKFILELEIVLNKALEKKQAKDASRNAVMQRGLSAEETSKV